MWMNFVPLNSLIIVELGITLVTHADQGYFIKADFFLNPLEYASTKFLYILWHFEKFQSSSHRSLKKPVDTKKSTLSHSCTKCGQIFPRRILHSHVK